jgi:hypothetical protein
VRGTSIRCLGAWISPDPLAVHAPGKADLNLYAYVHGRVLSAVDPVGLDYKVKETKDAITLHMDIDVYRPQGHTLTQADVELVASSVAKWAKEATGKYSYEDPTTHKTVTKDVRMSFTIRPQAGLGDPSTSLSTHPTSGNAVVLREFNRTHDSVSLDGQHKAATKNGWVSVIPRAGEHALAIGHEIGHQLGADDGHQVIKPYYRGPPFEVDIMAKNLGAHLDDDDIVVRASRWDIDKALDTVFKAGPNAVKTARSKSGVDVKMETSSGRFQPQAAQQSPASSQGSTKATTQP